MKLNRNIATIKKMTKKDDSYADVSPKERILIVWELTKEAWFLKDRKNAEQRLQRDVTNLIRK